MFLRDLPYLKGGIRIFNEKLEPDSGLNVCMECGIPKITIEIMELPENLDRYDGIREPYWGSTLSIEQTNTGLQVPADALSS